MNSKNQTSARIILKRNDVFLLGLRQNTNYANGKWMLPGGCQELHETGLECAIREIREELSVVTDKSNLSFAGVIHWYNETYHTDGLTLNWVCNKWTYVDPDMTEPVNNEPTKCSQLKWFTKEQIMQIRDEVESTSLCILEHLDQLPVYDECDWENRNSSHLLDSSSCN